LKQDPTEVRYPGIQAKVQDYLRRRGSGRVTTAIVLENVGHNRTTISSAMATLARTPDTGLTDVSAGLYNYTAALDKEFVARLKRDGVDLPQPGATVTDPALKVTHPPRPTPAVIPPRRTTTPVHEDPVVVVTARTPKPEASVPAATLTRAGTARQRRPMQRDVNVRALRFLQENKGDIFSIAEVADGIGALPSSVSVILRNMAAASDFPVKKIMPGTLYTIPLTAGELSALERAEAAPEPVQQAPAPAPAPEPEPEPVIAPEPVPAPVPVAVPEPVQQADDSMILLEKLAETVPGKWLCRDADGQIFWVEKLR